MIHTIAMIYTIAMTHTIVLIHMIAMSYTIVMIRMPACGEDQRGTNSSPLCSTIFVN